MIYLQNDILINIYKYLNKDLIKIPRLSKHSNKVFNLIKNWIAKDAFLEKNWKVDTDTAYIVYKAMIKFAPGMFEFRKIKPINKHLKLLKDAIKFNSKYTVDFYLLNTTHITLIDDKKHALFKYAFEYNYSDIIQILVNNGAEINTLSKKCKNHNILKKLEDSGHIEILVTLMELNIITFDMILQYIEQSLEHGWPMNIEQYKIYMMYLLDYIKIDDFIGILTAFTYTCSLKHLEIFIKYFPLHKFEREIYLYGYDTLIIKRIYNKVDMMGVEMVPHMLRVVDHIIRKNITALYLNMVM